MTNLAGLYAISDSKLSPDSKIFSYLKAAIKGGVSIFQYRNKDSKDSQIRGLISDLQGFCDEKNVLFVLNDRRELALDLNVSAVHLGKEEVADFGSFRESFKGIIGVSCYNDLNLALHFEGLNADYVAFGAMFKSKIKPNAVTCPLEVLKKAKEILKVPICAIGGIDSNNANLLKNADMIAVISSLWNVDSKDCIESKNTQDSKKDSAKNIESKITQNAINLLKKFKSY